MEKEQFEQLFNKYYFMIFRVAYAQMKSRSDAEDIVQETFLRLLRYRPDFAGQEHEKAWLLRTAINLCHDLAKSKWKSRTVTMEQLPEQERMDLQIVFPQQDETLWTVLELEERYKSPMYLFYYEDYSVKEVAEILGIPENTVKTNLRRGREVVKEKLKRAGIVGTAAVKSRRKEYEN